MDVDVVFSPSSLSVGMRSMTWSMMALMRSMGMVGKDMISWVLSFCLVGDREGVLNSKRLPVPTVVSKRGHTN